MNQRIVSGFLMLALTAGPALADGLPPRAPGLWQSTTNVTGPDGKPVQNEVNVVTVYCVDALNDEKFFTGGQSACSSLNISGGGSQYNVDGVCKAQGSSLQIHMSLVYADAKDVQLKAVYTGSSGPITMTSALQWQGQCLPGMVPGDEGSLSGGVFSKTDNINDSYNQ